MPEAGRRVRHYQDVILDMVALLGSASAQGVFHELRRRGVPVGLATVYRTLQVLVAAGAVWVLVFGDESFYEITSGTVVDAFRCLTCGHTARIARLIPGDTLGPPGFFAPAIPAVISGVCTACADSERHAVFPVPETQAPALDLRVQPGHG